MRLVRGSGREHHRMAGPCRRPPTATSPCKLPDGGTTTNNTAWDTYVANLRPKDRDTYQALDNAWPATNPGVQKKVVGSGPYYASVNWGLTYDLAGNPAYQQPSGCSGAAGLAKYTGYCDPTTTG